MNVTDEIVELTKKLIEFESIASKTEQLKNVIDFVENYLLSFPISAVFYRAKHQKCCRR